MASKLILEDESPLSDPQKLSDLLTDQFDELREMVEVNGPKHIDDAKYRSAAWKKIT